MWVYCPHVYLSTILQPDTISQSVICTLRHQCHQPLIVAIKHGRLQIQISTIYNIYISIIVSTKGISLAHYTRPITVSLFLDISNLDSAWTKVSIWSRAGCQTVRQQLLLLWTDSEWCFLHMKMFHCIISYPVNGSAKYSSTLHTVHPRLTVMRSGK